MRRFSADRAALIAVLVGFGIGAWAAATGITTQQTRTAAPIAVTRGAVAAEGTSLAHARADHVHSTSGIGPDLSGEDFVTFSSEATLTAERVLSNGNNTTIDLGTVGQAQVDLSDTLTGLDVIYFSPPGGNNSVCFDGATCSAYVTLNGSGDGVQTQAGSVTFEVDPSRANLFANGNGLRLVGTDHFYVEVYPDGSGAGRKAYFGFAGAADNNFSIKNEINGSHVNLVTTGAGVGQVNGNTIWHAGNDGVGSGVDADTVDGATATDDSVLVANGTSWQTKTIADCDNATTSKLLYDTTTNAFSCGTDQDSGGGTPAPANGEYVTYSTNATLSAERVLSNGTNTTVDTGTAGQAQIDLNATLSGLTSVETGIITTASDVLNMTAEWGMTFEGSSTVLLPACDLISPDVGQGTFNYDVDNAKFVFCDGQAYQTIVSSGTGVVAINQGGTGQTGATAAFDALAPTTTQGDISYHNGTDNVRLAKGTAGQVLTMNSGATAPSWVTPTQLLRVTGDVGNATTSYANITGLTWTTTASATYFFECYLMYTSSATTTGIMFAFNGPGSITLIDYYLDIQTVANPAAAAALSANVVNWTHVSGTSTSYDFNTSPTGATPTTTATYFARMQGTLITGATTGTAAIRHKSETANTTTVKTGSWCTLITAT